MLKRKFIFAVSVLAILAVGNAYATDPADTQSTTDTVGTKHTVYTAATNAGAANAPTNVASGIAGVTYVNRMVNVAGNAAQAAESHAAAAGASALSAASAAAAAQTAANNAQTTANGVANKLDKTSTVKKAIVTTDKDGKLAPVVISDKGSGTYITGVTVSDAGEVTLSRGTPTAYSLPVATSTKLGGVKAGGANITIASDGVISATDTNTTYSAGTNISLDGTTFNVSTTATPTQNSGVPFSSGGAYTELNKKQDKLTAGTNITISNGTISATDTKYSAGTNVSLDGTTFNVSTTATPTQNSGVPFSSGGAYTELNKKQDKLTAGTNITISNGTISATDTNTTYSAGTNISLSGTTFNVSTTATPTQNSGVPFSSGGAYTELNKKQDKLTAGTNITISNGTISAKDTTYAAGKNVTITDGNKINAMPVNSTTESDTLTEVFPSVSMMRAEMDDLAGDLNSDVADLQNTSVKHAENTAVGTTTTPVYVTSDGAAKVVTGIDSSLLPAAKSDALGGVKIGSGVNVTADGTISVATASGSTSGLVKAGTNVSISNGAVSVANATATTKGVAMLGVIPAGADKSGTATIWVE